MSWEQEGAIELEVGYLQDPCIRTPLSAGQSAPVPHYLHTPHQPPLTHHPAPGLGFPDSASYLLAPELVELSLCLGLLPLQPSALGHQVADALQIGLDVAGEGVLGPWLLAQALEGIELSPQGGMALLERPGPLDLGGHALAQSLQRRHAGCSYPRQNGRARGLGVLIALLVGLENEAALVHGSREAAARSTPAK